MTPQAFSYPTVSNNGKIYIPPYGLNEVIDYMLKFDPADNTFKKIPLQVNALPEKWQCGIAYRNKVYFLPYNEDNILVVNNGSIVERGNHKFLLEQNQLYTKLWGIQSKD